MVGVVVTRNLTVGDVLPPARLVDNPRLKQV